MKDDSFVYVFHGFEVITVPTFEVEVNARLFVPARTHDYVPHSRTILLNLQVELSRAILDVVKFVCVLKVGHSLCRLPHL